jgi:hypothetical protein
VAGQVKRIVVFTIDLPDVAEEKTVKSITSTLFRSMRTSLAHMHRDPDSISILVNTEIPEDT